MRDRVAARVTKVMKRVEGLIYDLQRLEDKRVKVPLISGLRCSASENWMLRVLAFALPQREGDFIDVGVNLGQTLIKLRALDPTRKYIGFEPNPTCVFYTQELIRMNEYRNCTLVPVGLFTETAVLSLDLFTASPADSAASLIPDFRPGGRIHDRVLVPVFTFDQVAATVGISKLGFVKVDVEGAELEVLKSMQQAIAKDRPTLSIEILPAYNPQNVPRIERQAEIARLLSSLDYTIFRVEKDGADEYRALRRLDTFDVHADLSMCDYLLSPAERADDIYRASLRAGD